MDERKRLILNAIINSYILNPSPVGSRTISKEYNLGISSATIRNEMADLEDLGYLNKPHTSAGRIPSNKAFRLYVDEIFESGKSVDKKNLKAIKNLILEELEQSEGIYESAAKALARITNLTSYVQAPKKMDTKIKYLELFPLDNNLILLLLVGNRGETERAVLFPEEKIPEDDLKKISNMLFSELKNLDLESIKSLSIKLEPELLKYKFLIEEIINYVVYFSNKVGTTEVYFDGITNILRYEEYQDLEKAREFMTFLEDRENIISILNHLHGDGIQVFIGSEIEHGQMEYSSMINSIFAENSGQIGILGPVRMDYRKLINIIGEFSAILNELVERS